MGNFARYQVRLHAVPVGDLEGVVPRLDAAVEVLRFDPERYRRERAWLEANAAPGSTAGEVVLCHGAFQPMVLVDVLEARGDPYQGRAREIVNWSRAVLAEPEMDVAYTLLAFWSGHFFAPTRPKRTTLRMVREPLIAAYRTAYSQARPVDRERLRFWRAFHALREVALQEGGYETAGDPLGGADARPAPDGFVGALHKHFLGLTRC